MSNLAEIYKQAYDLVIEGYKSNPEDACLLRFIEEDRTDKRKHKTVMDEFMRRVEAKVDELLAIESVPATVQPTKAPVKPKVEHVDSEFNGLGLN
jgi:hypothetical protein